jgi:hypothetical protein
MITIFLLALWGYVLLVASGVLRIPRPFLLAIVRYHCRWMQRQDGDGSADAGRR